MPTYYDPVVYDAQKNIIGSAPTAPGGYSANVMYKGKLTPIGHPNTIYATRKEAEDVIWAAYLKHNPQAVRPATP